MSLYRLKFVNIERNPIKLSFADSFLSQRSGNAKLVLNESVWRLLYSIF